MSTLLFSTLAAKLNPDPPPEVVRSPVDQDLYDACRTNLPRFAKHFFPHWCDADFNDVHLDYYALESERLTAKSRGHLDVVAAPRGASKTTGCALIKILHACVYHTESFILYITNTYDNAEDKVNQVKNQLEFNKELVRIYGPQVGTPWNKGDLTTVYHVRVKAAARHSQMRGLTDDGARPSLVMGDDVEHPEAVLTELQRQKTLAWWMTDILNIGQPKTNFELSGTVLHPESLLATMLKNPGWQPRFYQAVQQFADASSIPLWQEWRAIFVDLSNKQRQENARAFFEAHREEMLAGSKVLWAARLDYYALMVLRLIIGDSAWFQEQQNNPLADSRYLFDLDNAAYCTLRPEGLVRADGTFVHFNAIHDVAGYIDPTPEKRDVKGSDYACCAVGMKDRDGYEYLVGVYIEQEGSTTKQIAGVVDLLWQFQVPKLGIEANGFASLMVQDIREAIAQRAQDEGVAWDVQLIPIVNMRNKILRIKSLEPRLTNGWLQLARTLPAEYFRQLREYLPIEGSSHDDAPDATEGLVRVLHGLYEKRDMY